MGISPRSRCSARSSMALIAYSPLAEILIRAASPRAQAALEQPRRLPGEVGDDDVGAGAAEPGQGLEHRAHLVEPAELAGGADHRVLAGHPVGGQQHPELELRVRDRGAREQLQRRVVAHGAVLDHAAVAVARVLAQAHVGDDEEVGHRVLHGAHRLLDDAVVGVRLRAARVLLRRDAEEKHAGDAHAGGVLALLDQLVHREAVLTRHRRDRLAHAAPVHDEQRVDEVVDRQRRLAHELAEQRLLAQPTRAEHALGHQSLLPPPRPGRFRIRADHSTIARARAGIVYSAGMMSVARPYSAAVAAVMGPIEATATRPRHARRSASLNISAKFRAVDDEVKVTASTAPALSASPSRALLPSARRGAYAGTPATPPPAPRRGGTTTSRGLG